MKEAERKLGPYTLVNKIGRGAFGVVWLAEKRSAIATTRFALKLPRDEDIDLEAFKQEAVIWLQASGHPNVVPLIEADIYDEQVIIVSEYVTDGSLNAWLTQHGGRAPSIEAACELMKGVLTGLAHLHAQHIIHRDLKPDNILLQHETPRLADFGIARLLKSGSYSTNVSGTLAYMALEAFDGKRLAADRDEGAGARGCPSIWNGEGDAARPARGRAQIVAGTTGTAEQRDSRAADRTGASTDGSVHTARRHTEIRHRHHNRPRRVFYLWTTRDVSRQTLMGYTYGVSSVVFSPDGKTLASGSDDKTIKLWQVE